MQKEQFHPHKHQKNAKLNYIFLGMKTDASKIVKKSRKMIIIKVKTVIIQVREGWIAIKEKHTRGF